MTHREQQKKNFWIPTKLLYRILNIVGDGMFEWAVISKRSFAHKGSCFEHMPGLFSYKFLVLILSVRSYVFFGDSQKIIRNRNPREKQNVNILTGSVCFDFRLVYCSSLIYSIINSSGQILDQKTSALTGLWQ